MLCCWLEPGEKLGTMASRSGSGADAADAVFVVAKGVGRMDWQGFWSMLAGVGPHEAF